MCNTKRDFMTLSSIFEDVREGKLELPSVQRGFVWKPYQIENLWDSVLRGYPIGAVVVSSKTPDKRTYLLDGQQRLTALCLGMADLEDKNTFFHASLLHHRIFIDLKKPKYGSDPRKFYIRVTTRSHPWGYQRGDNTKTLIAGDINNWLQDNNINDPLNKIALEKTPHDAELPVPLNIFTSELLKDTEISNDNIKEIVYKWFENHQLLEEYNKKIEENEFYTIDDIYTVVCTAIKQTRLPILELNENNELKYDDIDQDLDEDIEDENQKDEIENMFIRLNSAGTPISGEELNYSLLKSSCDVQDIKKIEDACKGIMRPARFITLAFRLWQNTQKNIERNSESLQMRIKPRQFRNTLNGDQRTHFHNFLKNLLECTAYNKRTFLQYIQYLLLYGNGEKYAYDETDYRLPFPLFMKLSESAPEVIFLLMYRLYHNKDRFKQDEDTHRSMLGILLYFLWLGKDARGRHAKLLSRIWPVVRLNLDRDDFWSDLLLECAGDTVQLYPRRSKFNLELKGNYSKNFYKLFNSSNSDATYDEYEQWYKVLFYEKDILLYAQRHFLSAWFSKEEFMLDDRNTPFDWDHIAADSLQKRRQHISPLLKEIYQTNGNFRAWPYELNRSDQNALPSQKLCFNDDINNLFLEKERFPFTDAVKTQQKLETYISKFSFNCIDWKNCQIKTLNTESNEWKYLFNLILQRIGALDEELRDNLFNRIRLFPNKSKFCLSKLRIRNEWHSHKENDDENEYITYSLRQAITNNIYFYFIETKDKPLELGFRLSCKNEQKLMNILCSNQSVEEYNGAYCIYTNKYPLLARHPKACKKSIKEILKWLEKNVQKKYYTILSKNIENAFQIE